MPSKTPKLVSRMVEIPTIRDVMSIVKKRLRLITFMADYKGDTTVFDKCKQTSLNTYIEVLRGQVERMESSWNTMREDESLSPTAFEDIGGLFERTQKEADENLDLADKFCNERAKKATEEDVKGEEMLDASSQGNQPSRNTGKQYGRLDNTLKPDKNLSKTVFLEEATTWITQIESYYNWSKQLIVKKSNTAVRNLLESSLEAGLVSKLWTDVSIGTGTKVQGPGGDLAKLKGCFIADYPLVNSRNDFTKCTQGQEEKFKEWKLTRG